MEGSDYMTEEEEYRLEAIVRGLRNRIYGTGPVYGTDAGWRSVRDNWMKPENVKWLQEQVVKCTKMGFFDTPHFP